MRKIFRNVKGMTGLMITGIVVLAALLGPLITPHDPFDQDITHRLLPPAWMAGGTSGFVLGTDPLGRDILSRLIVGARYSLAVAAGASVLAAAVGVTLGTVAGFRGGLLDQVVMRLVDIQLAFPYLLLAVTILAVAKPGMPVVILILALTGWPTYCRMVRARVLALSERDFIQAARALGAPSRRIILRHILPNVLSLLIIIATLQLAQFILAEATLSFLGLGLPPTVPTWGGMINEGQDYIFKHWWVTTVPGLMLVVAVSGVGLLGDWIRDRLDPRLRI
jgi:peptide/nickel transport system permease protein